MKILLLCGGFGTRLERDLKAAIESEGAAKEKIANVAAPADEDVVAYASLLGLPKGLLPIGGKALLTHWVELITKDLQQGLFSGNSLDDIYLLCNELHHPQFQRWAEQLGIRKENIFNNGVLENAKRNGSVADLLLAIKAFSQPQPQTLTGNGMKEQDLLVIAGDTWIIQEESLKEFIESSQKKFPSNASTIVHYPITDKECLKSGVLEVDSTTLRVTGFLEKPDPSQTTSRLGCPCFYYLRPAALDTLSTFLDLKKDEGLDAIDAAGKWIQWLIKEVPIYALPIKGRLDIGGLDSYLKADSYMKTNAK